MGEDVTLVDFVSEVKESDAGSGFTHGDGSRNGSSAAVLGEETRVEAKDTGGEKIDD